MGIAGVIFCTNRASVSAVGFWKRAVSANVGDVPEFQGVESRLTSWELGD